MKSAMTGNSVEEACFEAVAPDHQVEIRIVEDVMPGTVKVWVNVDGMCRMRVSQIPVNKLETYIPNPREMLRIALEGQKAAKGKKT